MKHLKIINQYNKLDIKHIVKEFNLILPNTNENVDNIWYILINQQNNLNDIKNIIWSEDCIKAVEENNTEKLIYYENQLENLSTPLLSKVKSLEYVIPEHSLKLGDKIDESLNKFLEKKEILRSDSEIFYSHINTINILFKEEKISFGKAFMLGIYSAIFKQYYSIFKENFERLDKKNMETITEFNNIKEKIVREKLIEIKAIDISRELVNDFSFEYSRMLLNIELASLKFKKNSFSDEIFIDLAAEFEDLMHFLMQFLIEDSQIFEKDVRKLSPRKSVVYYLIPSEFIKDAINLPCYNPLLPMIVKANPWKLSPILKKEIENEANDLSQVFLNNRISKEYFGLFYGGYLKNKKLRISDGISKISANSSSIASQEYVDSLNFLQDIPYRINNDVLENIFKNFGEYLIKYIESADIDSTDFYLRHENGVIEIIDLENYLEKKVYSKNVEDHVTNKNLKNKYTERYNTLAKITINFIITNFLAFLFKDKKLYFTWFLDLRGRFYCLGYLLLLQGTKLAKSLLEFYEKPQEIISENNEDLEFFIKDISTKNSEFFTYERIKNNCGINFVSLDATASGTSIMSALVGDIEGLKYTNVLTEGNINNKKDPYLWIMSKTLEIYESKLQEFKSEELDDLFIEVFSKIKEFYSERKYVKDFMLCFNYSEGSRARILKLMEWLKSTKYEDTSKTQYYAACSEAEKCFINAMEENFPHLIKFRDLITGIFDNNRQTSQINKQFEAEIKEKIAFYNDFAEERKNEIDDLKDLLQRKEIKILKDEVNNTKKDVIKIIHTEFKKKHQLPYLIVASDREKFISAYSMGKYESNRLTYGKKSFTLKQETDTLNVNKIHNSCVPHLIHNLDSTILEEVLQNCRKQNIKIFTAHDSFYVSPVNTKIIKKFYFNAFIKILLENNPIEVYLEVNNLILSEENKITLKIFNENKKKIISDIRSGKFQMNNRILC